MHSDTRPAYRNVANAPGNSKDSKDSKDSKELILL